MNKSLLIKIIGIIIILLVLVVLAWFYFVKNGLNKNGDPVITSLPPDISNCSFDIDGNLVELKNGSFEKEIVPGSASKIEAKIVGNQVAGDINRDGNTDSVAFLMFNSGGSGTFYYVISAIANENKCVGSNGFFIGDRIINEKIEIKNNSIIVNYKDHLPTESFTDSPSVNRIKYLTYINNELKEEKVLENLATECAIFGGTWISQYSECEINDKFWCEESGGQFNECSSACRHNLNIFDGCIGVCVPVCIF